MFNVLGYLLLAAPLFMVAPQVFRTVKRRDVSGVSVSMQVGLVGSWFMWGLYGLSVGSLPVFFNNMLGFVADMVLLVLIFVVKGVGFRKLVASEGYHWFGLSGVLLAVIVSILFGFTAGVVVLAVADFVVLIPQLLRVFMDADIGGVSVWPWVVKSVVTSGWIVYGFGAGIPLSVGWAFLLLPVFVAIMLRIVFVRYIG